MKGGDNITSKKTPMTPAASQRIQSAADKSGTNQGMKARTMKAAAKNTKNNLNPIF